MGTELRDSVARGVAWTLGEKAGSMLLQMGVSIVVARLLSPNDYGVMAILTVFVTLMLVVVDSGFSQTLIRSTEPTKSDYRSVFVFNVAMSLLLYVVMVLLSPLLARYFEIPIITKIAPILFLLLPLNALCVIQQAIFARQFKFDTLSKVVFLSSLFSGVVAVVLALSGCGVWSLVGQRLASMASKALMLWWVSDWRPEGLFSGSALKAMAPYSLRLMTTDLITALYNNISQLFVGKIYSTQTLGYYNQGQKLKDVPVLSTLQSVQNVTFPALSKIKDDALKFKESYRQLISMVGFILFPIMAGLIAVAPTMFELLLGEKWMPSVPYFEVLCLSGLFMPLSSIAYNVLKVKSDGRVIVRLEILKKSIMTIILAATIPFGVMAISWGVVAMAMVEWLVNSISASRFGGECVWRVSLSLLPSLILSSLMLFVVRLVAHRLDVGLLASLSLQIVVGVAIYTFGAVSLRFEQVRVALDIVRKRGRK